MENKGVKHDNGKPMWSYLPIKPIIEVVKVLEYGDKKYPAPDGANWKRVEDSKKRYFNACMRHMTTWYDGEENDPETGYSHLAHACACVLFLLWFSLNRASEIEQESLKYSIEIKAEVDNSWEGLQMRAESEEQQRKAEEEQNDGWITWNGGECPVADDIPVVVRFANDTEDDSCCAGGWGWSWDNKNTPGLYHIVAYKVVK